LSTRETVWCETPARRATSAITAPRRRPSVLAERSLLAVTSKAYVLGRQPAIRLDELPDHGATTSKRALDR
jgi:hypothetical protein